LIVIVILFILRASEGTGRAADAGDELKHAKALQQAGKLAEARPIFARVVDSHPSDKKLESDARLQLSRIDLAEGHHAEAVNMARQAAVIAHAVQDPGIEGNALNTIGMAETYLGLYSEALADFKMSLVAARASHDLAAEVTRLNNLGNVLFYQGRYADAMQQYRDALKIVDGHAGEAWNASRRQLTIANVAALYQRLGQYRNALATYDTMHVSSSALPAVERAQLLTNMGALYRRLGDPVKALETYRAAQALYRENALRNGEITVLNNIGIAQVLDLNAEPDALRSFDEAFRMAQESGSKPMALQSRLYRGETLFRLSRYGNAQQDFEGALALAREVHAPEDEWKALYGLARCANVAGNAERARKDLEQSVEVIENIRSNAGTGTPRNGFLADKRQVYDLLIELELRAARPDVKHLYRLMEQSRARSLKDVKRTAAMRDADAVQRVLAPGTLFLEYWMSGDAVAVLWMTNAASGTHSRMDETNFRKDITDLAKSLSKPNDGSWRERAARVSKTILGGLESQLSSGTVRRIIVVPDRELAGISLDVLPIGASGKRLIDVASISYLPTAALLRGGSADRKPVPFWTRTMLAFADPAPSSAQDASDLTTLPVPGRLPGAVAEVEAIAGQLNGRISIHSGAEARKQYLDQVNQYAILHLATHAAIDPEDANRSYILFAPSRPSQAYDPLFLKEVPTLNLDHVDLVTASACETQSGVFVEGEGVENFSQAFLSAGARGVVTSLWRVDDRATASLMERFYRNLADGQEGAEGLRRAKLSDSRHPFYWAAFVLSGDGGVRLPRVISWFTTLAAALLIAAIALVGAHFVRMQGRRGSR
jgi:CHAT domain-containing protein